MLTLRHCQLQQIHLLFSTHWEGPWTVQGVRHVFATWKVSFSTPPPAPLSWCQRHWPWQCASHDRTISACTDYPSVSLVPRQSRPLYFTWSLYTCWMERRTTPSLSSSCPCVMTKLLHRRLVCRWEHEHLHSLQRQRFNCHSMEPQPAEPLARRHEDRTRVSAIKFPQLGLSRPILRKVPCYQWIQ